MQVAGSDSYSTTGISNSYQNNFNTFDAQLSSDSLVLGSQLGESSSSGESVDLNFQDLYKSLTITAKQMVDRLNEILKNKLPDGLQSLKPEEVTPEATSDNVVKGITSLFAAFAKQNSELSPQDLVTKFIEEAKKGVEQGYGDAKEILSGLGALEIDGVEAGISSTKELILTKLDKFAELKLEELTGKTSTTRQTEELTKTALLQQGGTKVLDLAA